MSAPFYFFDVSPVEKLLSGLIPHTFLTPVSQAVPFTMVLRYGAFYIIFSNVWIHIYQNVKMYSASVHSL